MSENYFKKDLFNFWDTIVKRDEGKPSTDKG